MSPDLFSSENRGKKDFGVNLGSDNLCTVDPVFSDLQYSAVGRQIPIIYLPFVLENWVPLCTEISLWPITQFTWI